MNVDRAVQAITTRGFAERQARFLILVARHSGVCVMRQYSALAGVVFGQKTRKFFENLLRAKLVSTYDCAHNRARVFHLRQRAIYEAIGEPDSGLRRPPSVPRALERLMLLDAILAHPQSIWLASSAEKVEHFAGRGVPVDDMPRLVVWQGDQHRCRYFPDRLPIGVPLAGPTVFIYMAADPMRDDFRDLLQRHAALLERLPSWTIRIVVPAYREVVVQDLQKAAWNQLASPLREPLLTELRWYFSRLTNPPNATSPTVDRARFERCRRAFSSDRYTVLYRCFKQDGERVLRLASSQVLADAIEGGAGKFEPLVLPLAYSHLAPLAGVA